jgi:hypothetical protein
MMYLMGETGPWIGNRFRKQTHSAAALALDGLWPLGLLLLLLGHAKRSRPRAGNMQSLSLFLLKGATQKEQRL